MRGQLAVSEKCKQREFLFFPNVEQNFIGKVVKNAPYVSPIPFGELFCKPYSVNCPFLNFSQSNFDFEWQRFHKVVNLSFFLNIRKICGLKMADHVQSSLVCHKRRKRCILRDWLSCEWKTRKTRHQERSASLGARLFWKTRSSCHHLLTPFKWKCCVSRFWH